MANQPYKLNSNAINWDWQSNTYYAINTKVCYNNDWYTCIVAHTSTDVFENTNWELLNSSIATATKMTSCTVNSGNTNSLGNSDLVAVNGSNTSLLDFKVGGAYANMVATTANQTTFTASSVSSLDVSSYYDDTYNIFVNQDSAVKACNGVIYRQRTQPATNLSTITITGTPTVTGYQISNFSNTSPQAYFNTVATFNPGSSDFVITTALILNADASGNQLIFRTMAPTLQQSILCVLFDEGHEAEFSFKVAINDADGNTLFVTPPGNFTFRAVPSTLYYFKIARTDGYISMEYSLDGVNYIDLIPGVAKYIGYAALYAAPVQYGMYDSYCLDGAIDLTKSYITVAGAPIWMPYKQDVWIDTSKEPLAMKKIGSTSWENFNYVHTGTITTVSGAITSVTSAPFNYNGYDVNTLPANKAVIQSWIQPDLTTATSVLNQSVQYADTNMWLFVEYNAQDAVTPGTIVIGTTNPPTIPAFIGHVTGAVIITTDWIFLKQGTYYQYTGAGIVAMTKFTC